MAEKEAMEKKKKQAEAEAVKAKLGEEARKKALDEK